MSNKDKSGESEALLNRTVDDDYVSELHKRNSAAQDHDPNQGRTLKIVLLCLLALMATGGLIAVIIALVNRNHDWIETKQETNMFKSKRLTTYALLPLSWQSQPGIRER